MSLILVEDTIDSFGDLIASCWDASARISIFVSGAVTIEKCLSQVSEIFQNQYGKRPIYASLHHVNKIATAQTLGVRLE
jgi:hypothetical protein